MPDSETPKPSPEQNDAKKQLKGIADSLFEKGKSMTESIFGRLDESLIPQKEIDKLMSQASKMTHTDLAKACYELSQKYRDDSTLPQPFEDWLKSHNNPPEPKP